MSVDMVKLLERAEKAEARVDLLEKELAELTDQYNEMVRIAGIHDRGLHRRNQGKDEGDAV